MSEVQQRIHATVTGNPVVLYMKGDARFPQCGFSATAVQILKVCGVDDFVTVNVLADEEIRNGVKEYANWPTIPQLYIKGEFVGGCDIMKEMYQTGELQQMLEGIAQAGPAPGATRTRNDKTPPIGGFFALQRRLISAP